MRKASSEKATSARDATVDGARSVREGGAVDGVGTASRSAAEWAGRIGAQGAEVARHTAERSRRRIVEGIDLTRERIPWHSVSPDAAGTSLLSAVDSSRALSKGAKRQITKRVSPALGELLDKGKDSRHMYCPFCRDFLPSQRDLH